MTQCSLVDVYQRVRNILLRFTLRMEALCPSETMAIAFQTRDCHNPEYHGVNIHLRQKPQSRLHPSVPSGETSPSIIDRR
jgi:hypothetical protein